MKYFEIRNKTRYFNFLIITILWNWMKSKDLTIYILMMDNNSYKRRKCVLDQTSPKSQLWSLRLWWLLLWKYKDVYSFQLLLRLFIHFFYIAYNNLLLQLEKSLHLGNQFLFPYLMAITAWRLMRCNSNQKKKIF